MLARAMATKRLSEVRALREARRIDEHRDAALALVEQGGEDAAARLEAAWALGEIGDDRGALRHYEAARALDVPDGLRRRLVAGHGEALRRVGRAEEAVAVLAQAASEGPPYPAFTAQLALALAEAGHPQAALATMLGCALDAAPPGAFDGQERRLADEQRRMLESAANHASRRR